MPPCAYTNGCGAIMTLKIENLGVIERAVKQRMEKLKPVFKEALGVEKERIKTRTQSGLDVDGDKFIAYRPYTVKNRRRFRKQVAHVDLTFDGDMFRAFKVLFSESESSTTGTLTFGTESWKVLSNEAYDRKFFGLSNEQIEIIKNKLRNVT